MQVPETSLHSVHPPKYTLGTVILSITIPGVPEFSGTGLDIQQNTSVSPVLFHYGYPRRREDRSFLNTDTCHFGKVGTPTEYTPGTDIPYPTYFANIPF